MSKYYSYDPAGDGMVYHDTELEAKTAANKNLEEHQHIATGDGWLEDEVRQLSWGRVSQHCVEVDRAERPPEDQLEDGIDSEGRDWGSHDSYADYQYISPDITHVRLHDFIHDVESGLSRESKCETCNSVFLSAGRPKCRVCCDELGRKWSEVSNVIKRARENRVKSYNKRITQSLIVDLAGLDTNDLQAHEDILTVLKVQEKSFSPTTSKTLAFAVDLIKTIKNKLNV